MAGENITPCVECVYFVASVKTSNRIGWCHRDSYSWPTIWQREGSPIAGCGKGFKQYVTNTREQKIQALAEKAMEQLNNPTSTGQTSMLLGIIEIAGKKVTP